VGYSLQFLPILRGLYSPPKKGK